MTERMRKKLLPGFPRTEKFQTKEEVDAYFAMDKIQCLLCGRWFDAIVWNHLLAKHGISRDDYAEMFGLPWSRGLTGALSFKKRSELLKDKPIKITKEKRLKALRRSIAVPHRPPQPFSIDHIKRLGRSYNGLSSLRPENFERVLERMREQERTANDVCGDPDMPAGNTWREYLRRHPEFKERYREILYELPYPLQSASFDFSPRFSIDCRRLRARGIVLKKIAKALGVSPALVRQVLDDAPGGFRPFPTAYTKWREEDFEAILDRMQKQQRSLNDTCHDPDLPFRYTWSKFVKTHPDFEKKPWRSTFGCHIRCNA